MKSFVVSLLLFCHVSGHSLVKRQEGDGGGRVPESREVAPNVYSFTSDGFVISMFMITSEGVMVIDPMNVDHSEKMLAEIRKITDAPIRYLFYSHNHWDHTKGGQIFKDEGATIISHIDASEFIKANPSDDLLVPDKNWVGERYDVSLGGMNLELHYLGVNHGNGMTIFILTNEKVGYIADVTTPKQVVFFFYPDFNIPGWIKTLEEYSKFDVDTIVFSHNGNYADPLETGDMETVRLQLQYLKDVRDAVRAELAKGTNAFQVFQKVQLPQYAGLTNYDNWFQLNVQATVVQEVLGPLSWRSEKLTEADSNTLNPPPSASRSSSSTTPASSRSSSGCFWRFKKTTRHRFGK